MKNLRVNVDGIKEPLYFKKQKDSWYSNEVYHLLINPEISYCISEQDSEFSLLSDIDFEVLEEVL